MTTKKDSKSKPKKSERPKIKQETLKDLTPDRGAEEVRGGAPACNGPTSTPWGR